MAGPVTADVLSSIGGTHLVPLRRLAPSGGARVLLKMECANPTGSMKDRMARSAIEAAERDGRLKAGGTVVEYTGGSTGIALALVCAVKGYRCRLVSSDAFSREKLDHMRALGAEVTIVPSDKGRITEAPIKEMISVASGYAKEPGSFWTDQLNNRDMHAGYHSMAEEIWTQTGGRIDAFVHSVGTAHSLLASSEVLRRRSPGVRIVAVEPAESPILSEGLTGGHRIEGIGIGFVPPLWDRKACDEVVGVSSDDAYGMARRLAQEEGLFAGASTGANVVAALRIAAGLPPSATVVTLMVDHGLKYLTTELYRSST